MKQPKSTGDGTTGAWKSFSEAYNKVGDEVAEKRRKSILNLKKNKKDFKRARIKKT